MEARRHVPAVADGPVHKGEMHHRIEGRAIAVALQFADRRPDRKRRDALDQLFARLAVGDEVGDGNALQLVPFGEGRDLRPDHHRAVVVGEFADHRDRRQPGELAEIDRGFGMARAHQNAAVLGDQREHMARPDEIARAHVAVRERARPYCSAARPKCRSSCRA